MSRLTTRSLLCVISLSAPLLFTGCSSSKSGQPVEIPTSDTPSIDATEYELFSKGKRLYGSSYYQVAIESFESIKNSYPLGPFAEFAEIKIADAKFEQGNYAEAATLYEEFLETRPSSSAVDYILFQLAQSYYRSNRGIGRDSEPLIRARNSFEKLLSQHPGSMYESAAKQYLHKTNQLIARSEEAIIAFYKKRENLEASAARQQAFELAWGAPTVAGINQVQVMQARRLTPTDETLRAPDIVIAARTSSEEKDIMLASLKRNLTELVTGVECDSSSATRSATVYLNSTAPELSDLTDTTLTPEDGVVRFALANELVQPGSFSCFETDDLTVSARGELTLKSVAPVKVARLNQPDRLVLSF